MSLYKEWNQVMDSQTQETIKEFWEEYSGAETRIYKDILENSNEKMEGKVSELAEKYQCREVIFMGFLDGINSSLKKSLDLDKIKSSSSIQLDIDYPTLFLNMLKAEADYLFNLKEWDKVLTKEERMEIFQEYKKSKTYHAEKKVGRNEPCPCGSGKKYKKCCGKN